MNQTEQESITSSSDKTKNPLPEFEGGKPHYWSKPEKGLVWETYETKEDGLKKRVTKKIGNHLTAIAWIDHLETSEILLLLEFQDVYNKINQIQIERSLLSDDKKLLGKLDSLGYLFKNSLKRYMPDYLRQLAPSTRYQITSKTGWDDAKTIFVSPTKTYGKPNLFFKTIEKDPNSAFNQKGTIEDWKTNVAIPSKNSSRLIFVIGCALAAPLLNLFDIESGGFHFFGESSKGKTLMLKVASSLIGNPVKYIQQWRCTDNALESVAELYNCLLLPLDELAQVDPKKLGEIVYMLANGKGKIRANRSDNSQPTKEWELLIVSVGEISIKQKISDCGNKIKSGQELRIIDVPAVHDPLSELGIFESKGTCESSQELSKALEHAFNNNYGTAFYQFITNLISVKNDEWISTQSKIIKDFSKFLIKGYENDRIICRAAERFSLIYLALSLAIDWGILPSSHYTKEEASKAVRQVFNDWIDYRGGSGSVEIKQAVERLKQLFQSSIYSNRIVKIEGNNTIASSTSNSRLLVQLG